MGHVRRKIAGSREAPKPKKGPALGWVITLAAAGGVVVGSAGTYFFSRPLAAQKQSPGGTSQAQNITLPPQQRYTPAPQPPGPVPPGKVWSVEHGHWHDTAVTQTTPAPAPATPVPAATLLSAPAAVTPAATTTPAPAAAPEEKKE